jgi:hypothetical protein
LILGEYFLGKVQKKIGNFAMPFKYRVSLAGHKSRCFSKPRKIWHFRPFMKSLKFLNPYLLRYRTRLILGTLFITISNIFAIYPAEVLRKGIDMVQDGIHVYALFKGLPMENELRSDFFNILFEEKENLHKKGIRVVIANSEANAAAMAHEQQGMKTLRFTPVVVGAA